MQKNLQKIGHFDDFWTFMAMYMIELHQFKKKLQEAQNQLKYSSPPTYAIIVFPKNIA